MEPTVGRVVHFNAGEKVFAALITGVNEDGTIDLFVTPPRGGSGYGVMDVKQGTGNGEWDWMPYQKGQAQKTEELEKKLEEVTTPTPSVPSRKRTETATEK